MEFTSWDMKLLVIFSKLIANSSTQSLGAKAAALAKNKSIQTFIFLESMKTQCSFGVTDVVEDTKEAIGLTTDALIQQNL